MRKLLLVDGHSLLYRAFFALPHLSTSTGLPTNALYGFLRMLFLLVKQYRPEALLVAFDAPGPTFRHAKFPPYKANRPPMPEALLTQVELLPKILDELGIAYIEVPNFEADDIIGTLSQRAEQEGFETLIVTGDNDALQLVSGKTKVLVNTRGVSEVVEYTPEKVEEKLGVPPEKVVDLKALQGDTSDNIPGVPGFGPKTAATLLQKFGSVENLLQHLDDLPRPAQRQALAAHRDEVMRNKELVRIAREIDLQPAWSQWKWEFPSGERLRQVLEPLEFASLIKDFAEAVETTTPATSCQQVATAEELEQLITAIKQTKEFALCCDWAEGGESIRGVSLAWGENNVAYLPLVLLPDDGHTLFSEETKHESATKCALAALLSDGGVRWFTHDAKRVCLALERAGILPPTISLTHLKADTFIMAYLLNPTRQEHPLPDLSSHYLHRAMPVTNDPKEAACVSAEAMLSLVPVLQAELEARELDTLYEQVEHPLIEVLAAMERQGMLLDLAHLRSLAERLRAQITSLEKQIYELAGEPFNIGSTKQLQKILFEKLNLQHGRRTKTGYSTNAAVLEKLAGEHEIVRKILEYRELTKLNSTYVEGLLKLVDQETRRIHTSFRQTGSATGRLSSVEPNLQNIPIRTELGREIRRAFVAPSDDWVLLSADYSQIELRVLAHITGDSRLQRAFHNDEDIHTRTAADIYGCSAENVTAEMRRTAKVINFGIAYGMSAYGLAENLSIPPEEAQVIIDSYFQTYPGVRRYTEEIVAEARRLGYVTTLLKRRRPIPDIRSPNRQAREFAERAAINSPIQGSAADIIKVAMVKLHHQLLARGFRSRMVLQVHDELVFEVPRDEITAVAPVIRKEMESAYPLVVPLKVDLEIGNNWRDMEPLGRDEGYWSPRSELCCEQLKGTLRK